MQIYTNQIKIKNIQNESELKKYKQSPAQTAYKLTNGKYLIPPHIQLLDNEITQAIRNNNARLIINMPPRHGKSELISKYLPFWFLGNYPDKRIILSSYEHRFAASFGRKVRDLIIEYGKELFNIELSKNSKATSEFNLMDNAGGMSTAGAGGPITGKGADLMIIDDPIKNDMAANSPTIRDNTWDWFTATVFTRLEPNANIIIVMTRWHQDDLCGRIINNLKNDEWKIIKLPALADNDDVLGRKYNEPLWQERYNIDAIESIRQTIGSYWFAALYQQEPTNRNGAIFKKLHFKYFWNENDLYYLENGQNKSVVHNSNIDIFIAVDLAISTSTYSDYTVAVVAGRTNFGDILIIDILREKIEPSYHLNFLQKLKNKYSPHIIGIEGVQYQKVLIENAAREGLPVMQLKADRDKISRALPIVAKLEQGIIYFDKNAYWLNEFEKELLEFPYSRHDDQVDAFAYIERIIAPVSNITPVSRRYSRYGLQ